jgi:hypothetical protein
MFTTDAFFDGLLNGLAHLKTTFGTVSKSKESVTGHNGVTNHTD